MELRLKVSEALHRKLKAMARSNDINMTAQAKIYISMGLRGDVDTEKENDATGE